MITDSAPDQAGKIPVTILGVPFDPLTAAEAVALIERMIASGSPHHLATANVDFVVQAQEDVELRRILLDAHAVFCDGTPLVWVSRWLGNPLPERVAGSDLVPFLIRRAAEKGYRLFLLGAAPAAAEQAAANLRKQYPSLSLDHYSPPFKRLLEMDHDEIRRRITAAKPDILLVSFGCPKQEKWIAMHYRSLGVPVSIGVGATIDFLAGQVKRAPLWMQRTGTEWLYRMLQEPRRLFRRYAKDLWVFGRKIFAQWLQLQYRRSTRPAAGTVSFRSDPHWQRISLADQLTCAAVRNHQRVVDQIHVNGKHCLLETSGVEFIDSTGVGLLIRLQRKLRAGGRQLVLLAPGRRVEHAIRLMRLENFFLSAPDPVSAGRLPETALNESPRAANLSAGASRTFWQGEITSGNAGEVWAETRECLETLRQAELTIDLAGVRFVDSSGVEVMLRAKKMAQGRCVKLSFTNLSADVRNVLRHAGVETLLTEPGPAEPDSSDRLVWSGQV